MLARRFTILCLIATLFAMALISLIEAKHRPAYSLKVQTSLPCIYETPLTCAIAFSASEGDAK